MSQPLRTSPRRTRQGTQTFSQGSQGSRDASPQPSTSRTNPATAAPAPVTQEEVSFAKFGAFHQTILNLYLANSMMDAGAVRETFRQTCEEFKAKFPENPHEYVNALAATMSVINARLKKYNLVIKRVFGGDGIESYYCLVNLAKVGIYKLQEIFKPAELEQLYTVIPKILESERGFISKHQAMIRDSLSQKISQSNAESCVDKFESLGFLVVNDKGNVSLGPRALAELEPFLRESNPDAVESCVLCRGVIIAQGYQCKNLDCKKRCHPSCFLRMIGPHNDDKSVKCPNCIAEIPPDVVQHYRQMGRKKCQNIIKSRQNEERKRTAVQQEEDDQLHGKKNTSPLRTNGVENRNVDDSMLEEMDEE